MEPIFVILLHQGRISIHIWSLTLLDFFFYLFSNVWALGNCEIVQGHF